MFLFFRDFFFPDRFAQLTAHLCLIIILKTILKIDRIKISWRNSFLSCVPPKSTGPPLPYLWAPEVELPVYGLGVPLARGSAPSRLGIRVHTPHPSVRCWLGSRSSSTWDEDIKADSDPIRKRHYCPLNSPSYRLLGTLSQFPWGWLWH